MGRTWSVQGWCAGCPSPQSVGCPAHSGAWQQRSATSAARRAWTSSAAGTRGRTSWWPLAAAPAAGCRRARCHRGSTRRRRRPTSRGLPSAWHSQARATNEGRRGWWRQDVWGAGSSATRSTHPLNLRRGHKRLQQQRGQLQLLGQLADGVHHVAALRLELLCEVANLRLGRLQGASRQEAIWARVCNVQQRRPSAADAAHATATHAHAPAACSTLSGACGSWPPPPPPCSRIVPQSARWPPRAPAQAAPPAGAAPRSPAAMVNMRCDCTQFVGGACMQRRRAAAAASDAPVPGEAPPPGASPCQAPCHR